MAATQAVLQIYELSEAIIIHLSPKEIAHAKRVSKYWNNLISSSETLCKAQVLVPLNKTDPNTDPSLFDTGLALYEAESALEFYVTQPEGFGREEDFHRVENQKTFAIYDVDIVTADLLYTTSTKSYVTAPPCQALYLDTGPYLADCYVYARDGIRVEHVQCAVQEVIDTVKPSSARAFRGDGRFRLSFETVAKCDA